MHMQPRFPAGVLSLLFFTGVWQGGVSRAKQKKSKQRRAEAEALSIEEPIANQKRASEIYLASQHTDANNKQ